MTLALYAERAPGDVRSAFLAGLRNQGVAEPGDPVAPWLPRAWSRPDIYRQVFAEHVLPVLGEPERAAAVAAISALAGPPQGRARPGEPEAIRP